MPQYPTWWRHWTDRHLQAYFGVPRDEEEKKLFRQFKAERRRAAKAVMQQQVQAQTEQAAE